MSVMHFTGWDIGGAHLKSVSVDAGGRLDQARQLAAPVWQGLDRLHAAFAEALQQLPAGEHRHAVTMTAELADCFADRRQGVLALLNAVEQVLGVETRIYMPAGLMDLVTARSYPEQVASANWHASAALVGQQHDQALLVDIGSTTSDIIPIRDGRPQPAGYTDRTRLQYDELVYTGVVRTPVMAIADRAPVAGTWQRLASEHFAVMADVYRLLDELPADADMQPTADGGARDVPGSARRLARMACADHEELLLVDWQALAGFLKQQQLGLLEEAAANVITRSSLTENAVIVGAGCGRFLARELADRVQRPYRDVLSLIHGDSELNQKAADMLPAYAMAAMLYAEQSATVTITNS